MNLRSLVSSLGAATLAAFLSNPLHAEPPIWEHDIGPSLGLTDDSEIFFTPDSFPFRFEGVSYSGPGSLTIVTSSNGFVSLGGSNGDGCCNGSPSDLVNGSFPRIAPLWVDMNPSGFGHVYRHRADDFGSDATDRLVITWDTIFYSTGRPVTVQLTLLSSGTMIFGYRCVDGIDLTRDALIGLSRGGGAPLPSSTDLSAALPFSSGTQSTIYELDSGAGGTVPFDIEQTNIVFEPNGQGGYFVSRLGSRAGTVDAGTRLVKDVVRINGSAGNSPARVVELARNQPMTLSLASFIDNAPTHYVLWVWSGSSSRPTNLMSGGSTLGTLVNPSPLNSGPGPRPIFCLAGQGMPAAVCGNVPRQPSPPFAPFNVTRAAGFANPIQLTIRGVIEDRNATNPLHYSVTNAVVLNVP